MAWVSIPNSSLSSGAPVRGVDAVALRDNPTAIANGDAGAPKIQFAAMGPNTAIFGNGAFGGIGTYFMGPCSSSTTSGSTVSASSLSGVSSGTWRQMFYTTASANGVVVYLRIA